MSIPRAIMDLSDSDAETLSLSLFDYDYVRKQASQVTPNEPQKNQKDKTTKEKEGTPQMKKNTQKVTDKKQSTSKCTAMSTDTPMAEVPDSMGNTPKATNNETKKRPATSKIPEGAAKKRPAASEIPEVATMKCPAASETPDNAQQAEEQCTDSDAKKQVQSSMPGEGDQYAVMIYKSRNIGAIRERTGAKRQVVSITGGSLSQNQVIEIMNRVCREMNAGKSIDDAKFLATTLKGTMTQPVGLAGNVDGNGSV